ncbi:cysteine proteinase [Coprinopsis marcescibilis]|uniref:ubiquitinyl hydrolase 1 n=1 Tax=Coprinopsis marcescibilis TaxID=230819 RepID=A0A5C3KMM2_COPMA|nr:cysteine proteinase [Coprinopsis marcescibilis]
MGTIETSENALPEAKPSSIPTPTPTATSTTPTTSTPGSPPPPTVVNPTAPWAIWSRRPHDPSSAPAIIFSPRTRPPRNIVEQAIDDRTPPPSPVGEVRRLVRGVNVNGAGMGVGTSTGLKKEEEEGSEAVGVVKEEIVKEDGEKDEGVDEGAPPSPLSRTSEPGQYVEDAREKVGTDDGVDAVAGGSTPTPTPAPIPAAAEPIEAVTPTPTTTTPATGATPAATPPNPPPKKSWASLLRPTGETSKNALPTSNVVGISIPASSSLSTSRTLTQKKTDLITLLTAPPSPTPHLERIRPRGLVNSGNMCFANSVLQVLVYCAPFWRLVSGVGGFLEGEGFPGEGTPSLPLLEATAAFLKEFAGKSSVRGKGKEKEKGQDGDRDRDEGEWDFDSFLPGGVYDAMKEKKRFDNMRGGHQEDAEEFLGFYLDTLEEELLGLQQVVCPVVDEAAAVGQDEGWMEVGKKNRVAVTRTSRTGESPITRIFGGKFRSTLRTQRQKDSVVVEDWRSLRLDIQRDQIRTIQDALSYISHPQPVQVTLATVPGVPVEATQQVLIESLPPILVLHIKRFCYDTDVKGVVKVSKQVAFGPELDVGPELMAPGVKKSTGTRYKLFGALYHHGQSASGGHYTLDVLHPTRYTGANGKPREGWIRIDDELVSDVRPEDVFGEQERDDARCAYLLFYRRVW